MLRARTAWLAACLLAALSAPAAAADAEAARAAVQRVMHDQSLQSAWPFGDEGDGSSKDTEPRHSPWRHAAGSRDSVEPAEAPETWDLDFGRGLAGVLRLLLILVALAGIAALIAWLAGGRSVRREAARSTPTARGGAPSAAPAPLADPELLARQGRFGEAIHALLLVTLDELQVRRARPRPRSLTAREAARTLDLPPTLAPPLSVLLAAVEAVRWSERPARPADWLRCAEAARQLRERDAAA